VSSTRAFTRRVIHLSIDADAPRAVISLAYRRNDRSPAVRNFVAVARPARRAAKVAG